MKFANVLAILRQLDWIEIKSSLMKEYSFSSTASKSLYKIELKK
ncbi:hypothetical protein SAI_2184 [Streptococcus agalactiae H36B]|nr:hypothetical protein SAI_2184 [Streptococcus agalactiae H36B]